MITSKYKLGDLCEFINGGTWTQKEYDFVGVKVVQVTNLVDGSVNTEDLKILGYNSYEKYKKHELKENDLVIATVGSHPTQPNSVVGRASCIPKEAEGYLLNQNAVCIRSISNKLDQKYLVYLGKSELMKNYIAAHARGSANQVRMSISALKEFTHSFPDIDQQIKIANILTNYDNLIEDNLKRILLLEETAELIYKEWFVNFRFPGFEKCEYIDGLPSNWCRDKLGANIEFVKGKKPKKLLEVSKENSVPYLLVDVLEGGKFLYTEESKVPLALENEVIMIMDGSRSGTIYKSLYGAIGSTMAIIRIIKNVLDNEYIYYFLKLNQTHIKQNNTGSAIPHANKEFIKDMEIIIPEKSIIKKFSCYARNISKQISLLKIQNNRLKEARDILKEKLVRGEIKI